MCLGAHFPVMHLKMDYLGVGYQPYLINLHLSVDKSTGILNIYMMTPPDVYPYNYLVWYKGGEVATNFSAYGVIIF